MKKKIVDVGRKNPEIFMDSGAFSAKTKRAEIDIDKYIKFIKDYRPYIDIYANLDVIGDAKATLENQKKMEAAGLSPIPCFHYGENWEWLEYYLDSYDYVAIGGVAMLRNKSVLTDWLDRCFKIICDTPNNYPRAKIHGFGVTSIGVMCRYPWYSLDSTSWVLMSRFGSILVPRYSQGRYVYDETAWRVNVSTRSPSTKEAGKHFGTFPLMEQHLIKEYVNSRGFEIGRSEYHIVNDKKAYELKKGERWLINQVKHELKYIESELSDSLGFSEDLSKYENVVERVVDPGLCNDYKQRDEVNVIFYMDLEKSRPTWPYAFQSHSISTLGFRKIN